LNYLFRIIRNIDYKALNHSSFAKVCSKQKKVCRKRE